jgi:hypothetical protein
VGIYQRQRFVPPLPGSVNDLKQRIITTVRVLTRTCSGVFGTNWIIVLISAVRQRAHT